MSPFVPVGPWDEFPDVWSFLTLDGKQWPGRAKISGLKRANKWDTKKAESEHGGERNFKGTDLASLHIEIEFFTSEQYDEIMSELLPSLESLDKSKQTPHTISHAVTIARKVEAITIDSITGQDESQTGIWKLTIDCTEHRPPTPKNASGKATGGAKYSAPCTQLAIDYGLAAADYAKNQAAYINAVNNLKSFSGGFGEQASDAATFLAAAQAALAKMALISAEQIARGCNNTAPSQDKKTTDP